MIDLDQLFIDSPIDDITKLGLQFYSVLSKWENGRLVIHMADLDSLTFYDFGYLVSQYHICKKQFKKSTISAIESFGRAVIDAMIDRLGYLNTTP